MWTTLTSALSFVPYPSSTLSYFPAHGALLWQMRNVSKWVTEIRTWFIDGCNNFRHYYAVAFLNSTNFQVAHRGCHMRFVCARAHTHQHTRTHTHTHTHTVRRYWAPSTFFVAPHVSSYPKSFLHSHFNFCYSHVFHCLPVGLDKPLHTNHKQTNICYPTQHFNVTPHSATFFGSRELSPGIIFTTP
jgi:hypothetical protein